MSGLEGLQAATSAFALVDLAHKTVVFIRQVAKARKDASELADKTQNLADLVTIVGQQLERRNERQANAIDSEQGIAIVSQIRSTLDMCNKCLEEICNTFRPLVATPSQKSLSDNLKYVRKQGYIATQERSISTYLAMLSVALQCLLVEDQTWVSEQDIAERQRQMQAASLQQLFALFRFILTYTPQPNFPDDIQAQQPEISPSQGTAQIAREGVLAIEEGDAVTIAHLIGSSEDPEIVLPTFDHGKAIVAEEEFQTLEKVYTLSSADDCREEQVMQLNQLEPSRIEKSSEETTLLLAIDKGLSEVVRRLVSNGANLKAVDPYGWTLLHHAVFFLREEIVDILLEQPECREPDFLNTQTKTGETALIYAVQRLHKPPGYNIAMKLLEYRCDVDINDGKGTALFYAVNEGSPAQKRRQSLVETLTKNGADVVSVTIKIPDKASDYPVLETQCGSSDDNNMMPKPQRRLSTVFKKLFSMSKTTEGSADREIQLSNGPS